MTLWHSYFTERELKEIEFCNLYKSNFTHGTEGHNIRIIVAKMAELLDKSIPNVELSNIHSDFYNPLIN